MEMSGTPISDNWQQESQTDKCKQTLVSFNAIMFMFGRSIPLAKMLFAIVALPGTIQH